MATMREIAEAINDDMRTRGAQLPEIVEVREELKFIFEVRQSYFDPVLWSKTRKMRVINKASA